MITGDNPLTAAAIAAEAGVDDFMAQATPEAKLQRIRDEQAAGHLVAMTGDGTNDAPALAQADVGVAMNTGTQAAREAGNMVDLDSNPTKLIEIVEIGKQLLMTRGSLTTFSIANDIAKYFAIIPAMLMATFPAIAPLNIMRLASPHSAILSAVIFNALIIVALIPLALRGVAYKAHRRARHPPAQPAHLRPRRRDHPFIGIKAIDVIITATLVLGCRALRALSAGRLGHLAARLPSKSQRQPASSTRTAPCAARSCSVRAFRREVFPPAPQSAAGNGYDAASLGRQQPRPHVAEAVRRHQGTHRRLSRRERPQGNRRRSRRRRHRVRQRTWIPTSARATPNSRPLASPRPVA
jgi:hypothetical protein